MLQYTIKLDQSQLLHISSFSLHSLIVISESDKLVILKFIGKLDWISCINISLLQSSIVIVPFIQLFEKKSRLEKVRDNYFKAFELLKEEEKIVIVDGTKTPEEIAEKIWNEVKPLFEK